MRAKQAEAGRKLAMLSGRRQMVDAGVALRESTMSSTRRASGFARFERMSRRIDQADAEAQALAELYESPDSIWEAKTESREQSRSRRGRTRRDQSPAHREATPLIEAGRKARQMCDTAELEAAKAQLIYAVSPLPILDPPRCPPISLLSSFPFPRIAVLERWLFSPVIPLALGRMVNMVLPARVAPDGSLMPEAARISSPPW